MGGRCLTTTRPSLSSAAVDRYLPFNFEATCLLKPGLSKLSHLDFPRRQTTPPVISRVCAVHTTHESPPGLSLSLSLSLSLCLSTALTPFFTTFFASSKNK